MIIILLYSKNMIHIFITIVVF